MGFDHRKLILLTMGKNISNSVKTSCPLSCIAGKNGVVCCPPPFKICPQKCIYNTFPHPPPPPPPSNPLIHGGVDSNKNYSVMAVLSVVVAMTAVGLLLVIFYAAIRACYLRRNNNSTRRRRDPPIFFGTQEDFIDEDHESETVDHPIWYINTIGLSQSVIDSITVFKYKKDDCLIEGTDCSVCLNEFQEDENLRLLPKCSHAFHITCIDTWLRSHKNCPLCRAPVINGTIADQASEMEPNSLNDSDSRNENMVENQEMIHVGEGGSTSEVRNGHEDSGFALSNTRNSDPDSADNNMQPLRRSVSLDSSSAMTIHNEVANFVLVNGNIHQGKSKNSKSKMVAKSSSSVSSSISSSGSSSLQKGPVSMKRSFSFTGKRSSSSRHSRRHSVLPL